MHALRLHNNKETKPSFARVYAKWTAYNGTTNQAYYNKPIWKQWDGVILLMMMIRWVRDIFLITLMVGFQYFQYIYNFINDNELVLPITVEPWKNNTMKYTVILQMCAADACQEDYHLHSHNGFRFKSVSFEQTHWRQTISMSFAEKWNKHARLHLWNSWSNWSTTESLGISQKACCIFPDRSDTFQRRLSRFSLNLLDPEKAMKNVHWRTKSQKSMILHC